MKTVLQELSRDRHTDRVRSVVHRSGIAATVAEKTRERIVAAILQVSAKNIARFGFRFRHAGDTSGLLAADFKTRQ